MAGQNERTILSPSSKDIRITKWKVKKDSVLSRGSVLALYVETDSTLTQKLQSQRSGIVTEILVEENNVAKPG